LGSIDFEVTDFKAARESLEEPPAGVKALKRHDLADFIKRRRPAEVRDRLLTPVAEAWLARMPREVRPVELARGFPRLANEIADSWSNLDACLKLLGELVVDRRGDRRGFPMRVALELVTLRDHRTSVERFRR
jgi:hypothetical protein